MVSGGNVTYTCKTCGEKFLGWASAKRIYCSMKCAVPAIVAGTKTHGESRSRLYQIWTDMKNRCYCKSLPGYEYYGARGITVCDEWREHYLTFRVWAYANGYKPELEIDRANVNGNYEPGNCRWATRTQQMCNTRKRRNAKTSKYRGVSQHSQNGRWIAQIGVNRKTIYLGSFGSEEEAAKCYDREAKQRFGEFAAVNFPEQGGVHC